MPKTRWEKIVLIIGPLLATLVLLATFVRGADRTDLDIFLRAAGNLEAGRPVYNLAEANEHTKPPLATVLFLPLRHVEPHLLGRIWDAMNIALFLALAYFFVRRLQLRRPPARGTWVVLLVLWLLNPWNKEIRLGQYNLLTFAMLLFAGLGRPRFLGGALAALAVLLKPTNVYFIPWVWKRQPARRTLIVSAGLAVLVLAGYYIHHSSVATLIEDHRLWLNELPLSAAKHLHRTDNYGLVRLLDEAGARTALLAAQIAGVALVLISSFFMDWATGLAAAAIVGIAFSPMAWFQNYVLLLPFVALLFSRASTTDSNFAERFFARVALLALYLGLQVFPALAGQGLLKKYSDLPVPIWALSAATAMWALSIAVSPFRRRLSVPRENPT